MQLPRKAPPGRRLFCFGPDTAEATAPIKRPAVKPSKGHIKSLHVGPPEACRSGGFRSPRRSGRDPMQWDDMWLKAMMIFGGIGFGGFAILFSRPLFPEAWNEPLLMGAFTLIFIKVAAWTF